MRFQAATVLLALFSATTLAKRTCRSEPDETTRHQAKLFAEEAASSDFQPKFRAQALVVDTYFHVVSSGSQPSQGNIPDSQLQDQLSVLNDDYSSAGISFNLKEITRTVNSVWARDGDELGMKKALRKGDYKTLNVYFLELSGGTLGYCYFPTNLVTNTLALDGCSVLWTTVPGGSERNYDLGRTATHEIGHWFGLFHTFQGGCSSTGDSVADTPAQRTSTDGCPIGKDTCTGANYPGVDPIHNFMDYSYDSCMYEFTPGQVTRINQFWDSYRA